MTIFAKNHQFGFTLVELSIVLVILGLLVGGVLTGQSLIRASELRSVMSQQGTYVAAVNSFKDKYFAIPGDMTNAQSFWGVAHATPATCATTASTTALTCNGDGNGILWNSSPGSNEQFRFWQHLANAGLITGTYSGITQGSTPYSASSANSPVGKINGTLWYAAHFASYSGNPNVFDGLYNHIFMSGMARPNTDNGGPAFKPEEAWNMDTKMDDGKPATGAVVIYGWATCTDAGASSTLTASYQLSSSALGCAMIWRQQF